MPELNFVLTLSVAVLGPVLAIRYLQPILIVVLDAQCPEPLPDRAGAQFWLRSAYVLAIAGSLLLALSFGAFEGSMLDALRRALWLAAAGSFVSIAFITRQVWAPVRRRLAALAARPPVPSPASGEA